MNGEYFHIKTEDVKKIAEEIYGSLAEMFGLDDEYDVVALKTDIINDIERIINEHEKKLGE